MKTLLEVLVKQNIKSNINIDLSKDEIPALVDTAYNYKGVDIWIDSNVEIKFWDYSNKNLTLYDTVILVCSIIEKISDIKNLGNNRIACKLKLGHGDVPKLIFTNKKNIKSKHITFDKTFNDWIILNDNEKFILLKKHESDFINQLITDLDI